jgi:superfamily II DNA/RNA helicase
MDFRTLGLSTPLAERLEAKSIKAPTEIQQEAFPLLVEGKSVLGFSKTGSGKTYAYMLPLVEAVVRDGVSPRQKILVLVPTRELATQVATSLEVLTGGEFKSVVIVGGEAEDRQIAAGRDADWIIATPGRLMDLLERRLINLSPLKAVVFDEADRLLDMGFLPDIRRLFSMLPPPPQMCFFSATLHFGVDELSYEFGADCVRIGQEPEEATVEGLDHRVCFVGDHEKFHALAHFLKENEEGRGIVFSNYRERAHEIASRLKGLGVPAAALTAQLSQGQRTSIMQDFRDRKIPVLVASDLAARGLDVEALDFVVNNDLPEDPPTYVHRVGRTARAGRSGKALSLVGFGDAFRLEKLEGFLGKPIERQTFDIDKLTGPLPRFGNGPIEDNDRPPRSERPGRGGERSRRDGGGRRPESERRDERPLPSSSGGPGYKLLPTSGARPKGAPAPVPAPRTTSPGKTPAARAPARPQASVWARFKGWLMGVFGIGKGPTSASNIPARVPGRGAPGGGRRRRRGAKGRSPTTSAASSSSPTRR